MWRHHHSTSAPNPPMVTCTYYRRKVHMPCPLFEAMPKIIFSASSRAKIPASPLSLFHQLWSTPHTLSLSLCLHAYICMCFFEVSMRGWPYRTHGLPCPPSNQPNQPMHCICIPFRFTSLPNQTKPHTKRCMVRAIERKILRQQPIQIRREPSTRRRPPPPNRTQPTNQSGRGEDRSIDRSLLDSVQSSADRTGVQISNSQVRLETNSTCLSVSVRAPVQQSIKYYAYQTRGSSAARDIVGQAHTTYRTEWK